MKEEEIRAWAILLYSMLYGKRQITDIVNDNCLEKIIKFIKEGKL